MEPDDLDKLADAYLQYHATQHDEDFRTWGEVDEIVRSGDLEKAWSITLLLLQKANDEAIGYIAAGPLEDIIDGYGDEALNRIEEAFDKDPRLQLALSGVWLLPESPVLQRWQGLIKKYGFLDGRKPLSPHPDCWPTEIL